MDGGISLGSDQKEGFHDATFGHEGSRTFLFSGK